MSTGYIDLARAQQEYWDRSYSATPRLHGSDPSEPARWTAGRFAAGGIDDVLELGSGHGRDSLFFARQGFSVHATDFSEVALDQLRLDAQSNGLDEQVTATLHDVRDPLPPADASIGAVYAHLLPSMALSLHELRALVHEVHRVLRPGGVFVYTAFHVADSERDSGTDRGDGLVDFAGLTVRFLDRGLVDDLTIGWSLEDLSEHAEPSSRRPLWRVTQTK